MHSYKVHTNHYHRIDADRLYDLVETVTHRWSLTIGDETRLDRLKNHLHKDTVDAALSPQGLPEVLGPLTDEVLIAIRKAALSFRYDIRNALSHWRLENVGQLIEQVDEALEVPEDAR